MYMFKLQYDRVERKLKVYDEHNIWLGTVLLHSDSNSICTYIDHDNMDDRTILPSDGRRLTLDVLKSLAIELAATSGIDEDIIDELQEGWMQSDFECINFQLGDIIYSETKVQNDIDSQIFNCWMKK